MYYSTYISVNRLSGQVTFCDGEASAIARKSDIQRWRIDFSGFQRCFDEEVQVRVVGSWNENCVVKRLDLKPAS